MDCSLPALFMGFPRQEYWSGLPFPPLGYLPHPGIKPVSSTLAEKCFTLELPGKPLYMWFADVQLLNHAWLFRTPWTVIHQVPLSMGFSRQEYWSGLPFPYTWYVYLTSLSNYQKSREFCGVGTVNFHPGKKRKMSGKKDKRFTQSHTQRRNRSFRSKFMLPISSQRRVCEMWEDLFIIIGKSLGISQLCLIFLIWRLSFEAEELVPASQMCEPRKVAKDLW